MQHNHDSVSGVPSCAEDHKACSCIDDCRSHTEISFSHLDSWPASSTHTLSTNRANNIMSSVIQERCGCRWIWASSDADKVPLSPVKNAFVAVQTLGPTPSTNSTESTHVAERWLTIFSTTLILVLSGEPDLDFPQYDADKYARFRWPISRPTSTSWGICRHEAASPHAKCNQLHSCVGTLASELRLRTALLLETTLPCKCAADLLFCREADIQQMNNLSRSRSQ